MPPDPTKMTAAAIKHLMESAAAPGSECGSIANQEAPPKPAAAAASEDVLA
jgi:hypothetical protein